MAKVFGAISEWDIDSDMTEWLERLEQWFLANEITDEGRKRALFLSNIGQRGYHLCRGLSQNEPTSKTFAELKELLLEHVNPKPNVITQRFVFYRRDRRASESVKVYISELRRLSEHCEFGTTLDDSLRDRFVGGLNDGAMQQKLLAIKSLTLKTALDNAIAMEAAAISAKRIHGVSVEGNINVHKLGEGSRSSGGYNSKFSKGGSTRECYRCGGTKHLADKCPFKSKECYGCKQIGHAKRKCRSTGQGGNRFGNNRVHNVEEELEEFREEDEELEELESDLHVLNLYRLGEEMERTDPVMIEVSLNKQKVSMEVDTGAAVSVMSNDLYKKLHGRALVRSNLRLKTYTGEILRPLGTGWLDVEYNSQRRKLPITVIEGSVPTLMGRNWLINLTIDWKGLFAKRTKGKAGYSGSGGSSGSSDNNGRGESIVNAISSDQELDKSSKVSSDVFPSDRTGKGSPEINKLFEDLKCKYPQVFRKCSELWKRGEINGVEDMKQVFPEVFRAELGKLKGVKIKIPIPGDATPRFFKPRSVPYALRSRVENELEKFESQGVWKKVQYSSWAAPIVAVLKDAKDPGGPVRVCGDYKITVNAVAPLDNYPIPNTNEQLATFAGGQKFSKIDLSQAYQQLELEEESKELLTVNTHKGLFRPERLQFGVHSATGIFQREMERVLHGIPFTLVRIDDILVTGKCDWDHFVVLVRVLLALQDAGFTVNIKKCGFFKDQVTFCGYTISKGGVRPMQGNVDAVLKAPEPSNVSQVKSFLGMLTYYQNYLPSLATIAEPIHRLLRKDVKWEWESTQKEAFLKAKKMLSEAPLLVHFDPSKKKVVHTDASPYGLGSVLSHSYEDGTERPVCYASRSLSSAERNYGHIEKEGLALVFAVKKFHHYLFGFKFTIYTDHKPLLGLFGENKAIPDRSAARIARWALLLTAYDYKLEYRQGSLNGNADALSRLPLPAQEDEVSQVVIGVHMMELINAPVNEADVVRETSLDSVISLVLLYVMEGWKVDVSKDEQMRPYWIRREELSAENGCLLWMGRVIVPRVLREKVLMELHDVHPGMTRMKALARSYVWWPKLDADIVDLVKDCATCALNQNNPASAPVHPWETPNSPWERIHMDFAGPLLGKMFLVVVDAYTKWLEVSVMTEATSVATVNKLRNMFATHGLPKVSVSDNGPSFVGEAFKLFMKKNGVKHVYSAPYHPASNGQAERMVRTFKEALKNLKMGDIQTKVDRLLYKYRIMPHSSTGKSPAEMMFQRQIRTPFHLLKPGSQVTEPGQSCKVKDKTRKFESGDKVWAKNFAKGGEKWVPGVINKKLGNVTYEVKFKDKEASNRHIDHLTERRRDESKVVPKGIVADFDLQGEEGLEERTSPNPGLDITPTPLSTTLRRSSRVLSKPAWTADYVDK